MLLIVIYLLFKKLKLNYNNFLLKMSFIKEWIVIYDMIKKEDLSLNTLKYLCNQKSVNIERCYRCYLNIYKMSYQASKKFVINEIEKNIYNETIQNRISLSLYELQTSSILVNIKKTNNIKI